MGYDNPNKSTAENIIEQINAKNAKKIAFLLVLGFAAYHGMLHIRYGIDSCKWLLTDGRYKGDQEWQPYGCMLHHYSHTDTRRCLRYLAFWGTHNRFVFIGDSRVERLYASFVAHLQSRDDEIVTESPDLDSGSDLNFVDAKLRVRVEFLSRPTISTKFIGDFRRWQREKEPPSIVIAGCATAIIKSSNASEMALKEYSVNLTRLVRPIDKLKERKTRVLWALQDPIDANKLGAGYEIISDEQIDLYNKAAIEVLTYSSADLWWSSRLVAQGLLNESPDGLHIGKRARRHDTQIILNMYCNDYMNFNDGTCCSSREAYTTLQIVTFSILGVCVIVAFAMVIHRSILKLRGKTTVVYGPLLDGSRDSSSQTVSGNGSNKDAYTLFTSLACVALIMCYFFVCDRTNFFMKENKYYSEFSFWMPVGYVWALGLFFTDDSRFTKVLHCDQTDECKGWMQLVILIYHMTGASRVLPIYMLMRVLVSGYLFLVGYGHFCYVWKSGDFGLVHFFQVLFRLNFLTVTLCLCMNRPYQFYEYVPLLSFWFTMFYVVLALPPQVTSISSDGNPLQYLYLVLKGVGFFGAVTVLYMSEVFFEKVFVTRPWKALFVTTDDDIRQWWTRWKTDRHSVACGGAFAAACMLARRHGALDDATRGASPLPRRVALAASAAAFAAVGGYAAFASLCRDRPECDEVHAYAAFAPIVGYVVLRNVPGALRSRYSTLFAWFGRISLELFVGQYHIWLAADTHGVLVLVPGYPALNVAVTSFVFVCASHELERLTRTLLPYAVPDDWRLVLRNFAMFLAVLVPIGINDGMF